jgi:hypothetical protein
MTFAELDQHRKLQEELDMALTKLNWLYDKAYPNAQLPSGMPRTNGSNDKMLDLADEIDEYKKSIRPLEEAVKESKAKVLHFIQSVPDRDLQLILRFRFVRNFPWKIVASYTGRYDTAKSVSQKVYDYFGSADAGCDD